MAGQANLTIYQGDDYVADVVVMEVDGITPADLTGYTAQSQIRTDYSDDSPTPAATFEIAINANTITMVLHHDVTTTLDNQSYVWDVQVIDSTGWITTLLAGQALVTKEVTKVYSARERQQTQLRGHQVMVARGRVR